VRQFSFRLRPTLMTTIVGLVSLTALAIGSSAAVLTVTITRTLIDQARVAAVDATQSGIRDYFADAPQFAVKFAAQSQRGLLPFDDRERLAGLFAEELRVSPLLHFVGYGDLSGWYVGAARYGTDEIVEYFADPSIDDGKPKEFAVAPDGERSAPSAIDTEPYLATTRPWFRQGMAASGPEWSAFYKFFSGGTGVSCVVAARQPGSAAATGVFHADMRLEGISGLLSELGVGAHGAVFLVGADGARIVSPTGPAVPNAAAAIDAAAPMHATASLAKPAVVAVNGRRYEIVFAPVQGDPDIGLRVGVVVDLRDISEGAYRHAAIAAGVALAALLVAIWCGRVLSSRIAHPIVAIAEDLANVGAFAISREPSPRSFVREVGELGASVDRMKASLRSFARYVPTDLVRRLLAHGQEAELGGELRRLTILFSDIANFTTISENIEPAGLVEKLGRYLELVTGTITRHGGTVDKFIGDGIMAFFNAPEELLGHPRQACLAALEAQALLAEAARGTPPGEPVFHTRIGLGLGEVLVGNIGTPERFAYTLLGDEVNLASRLEGLNKLYGTAIIASEAVRDEAGEGFEWRRLDRVAVKGRHQGTLICELMGLAGEIDARLLEARDRYETALGLYFAGDFERAAESFERVARLRPGDPGAAMMRNRCYLMSSDPPTPWDGVHVMDEK
jgi:adenylate cyclase